MALFYTLHTITVIGFFLLLCSSVCKNRWNLPPQTGPNWPLISLAKSLFFWCIFVARIYKLIIIFIVDSLSSFFVPCSIESPQLINIGENHVQFYIWRISYSFIHSRFLLSLNWSICSGQGAQFGPAKGGTFGPVCGSKFHRFFCTLLLEV